MPEPALDAQPDVVVRGAGPVGCTAALALRAAGLKVSLLEAAAPAPAFRPLALSYASRIILERLGVWREVAATPIETILVSQVASFGRARLDAADAGVPALGYVTAYSALVQALKARTAPMLTTSAPAARYVVHAEGTADELPGKRYGQDALVALVDAQPRARSTAFERFTPEGPLALLPHEGRYALIWSLRPERAALLAQLSERQFLEELRKASGPATGELVAAQWRAVLPLSLKVRRTRVAGNEVYIGNAAQTLHPVAGQGLNLGLRDAWQLAQLLSGNPEMESGMLLAKYAAARRIDAAATIRITDFLAAGFTGSNALSRAARGAALVALDTLPMPRRFFTRRMIFGASALP